MSTLNCSSIGDGAGARAYRFREKFTTVPTMESTSSDVIVVVVRSFFLCRKDYAYQRTWSRSTKQGIEDGERKDFKRIFCILSREGKAHGYLSIKAE